MKETIVLIGGGGHCKSCLEVIEAQNKYTVAGIVDVPDKKGTKILGYEIFAADDELERLAREYDNFLISLGQVKTAEKRGHLYRRCKELKVSLPLIVSPLATVSPHAVLKEGTIAMHGVQINAGARIGENCIINTGAIIEHDAVIEDDCHIATGSIVNGGCHIGHGSLVGSNSVLIQEVSLAPETIIGAGSVVICSIDQGGVYAGTPARKIG